MTVEELTKLIQSGLADAEIYAQDLTGTGDHFEAHIISNLFDGKSRLQRHQMVMAPLAEVLKGPLHALTLKTYTQQEWAKAQELG